MHRSLNGVDMQAKQDPERGKHVLRFGTNQAAVITQLGRQPIE
jgi:hypothetical protein